MRDQLILDDDALSDAASHFEVAAEHVARTRSAPFGEVTGLTNLEHRFNEFLYAISAARRVLGEAAQVGAVAATAWIVDSSEADAEISRAAGRTAMMRRRG